MGRIDVGLKCIQLRSLIEKREYEEAYKVAERINLDKVNSIVDLKVIASVYERLGKYEEAKDILLRSYEKKPTKMVIYRLAYLCVKTNEFEDAEFFYQEFSNMAPNSPDRYILRYGIDRAKGVDYLLRIATLQKLKQIDYMEEWGYELAKVYHKAGLYEECVQECNDLITWFGDGIIVEKAQMLRQFHEEGKESLDPYGVFDEGLSKEEIEARREQFIADTQDLRSQAMLLANQQKQQEVYRQLDRDLEKTVDLRQVLAEEGEDMDLLKQAVHRSWGQPSSNEYETINVKKIYSEKESNENSYDRNPYETQGNMHEFIPPQTPEEVIAASLAEVLTDEELGQDDWNGIASEEQLEQAAWNGYATEEYAQEFAQEGYVPQENETLVYSQDDFSSMMEQVEPEYNEEEYFTEEMSGEFSEEYVTEGEQGTFSEEYITEEPVQEFLEEGVTEVSGKLSQEEMSQESSEEEVNETEFAQEVMEESETEEAIKEYSQKNVEESIANESIEEAPKEVVEETAAYEAIEGVSQESVEETTSEEELEEPLQENSSGNETNASEIENTSKQAEAEIEKDIELFEDEIEIPAYVHRKGNDRKSIQKEKKNKKKVSKKKKQIKQKEEQKVEEKVVNQKQQEEQKAEEKAAKQKQQEEQKVEEKAAKQKQQEEQKAEEKAAKQKQQEEQKAEEKVAKQKQQEEQKVGEKAAKQKQQEEQKVEEKAAKQKQQIKQKEDKKPEKKKRKGFLFNWRKKKEKEVTPKMDVEAIGKELDHLIEEVNQREEAEREEFNTLPPEALKEREPVKKKVFTEDFSDVDPESMIGIGDSVGEPYIAKPKKKDMTKEQKVMPEATMEAGEYVGEPYIAERAAEAGEYVGEPYIAERVAEAGEYVGEPYIAGNATQVEEYVGEPYITKRAQVTEPSQLEQAQSSILQNNVAEAVQQEVVEKIMQEEEVVEETPQAEVAQDDFMYISGVDLWNYFSAYQNDNRLCEDIQMTLEGIKSSKRAMHMIITCKDQERASQMGRDMAKAMKCLGFTEKQRVARVTAEKLNRMHLEKNYETLEGGFLLVEGAKKMTADTAQSIMNMINEMGNQIVVILTDARPYMDDLMNEYKMMRRYFPNDLKMK